MAVFSSLCGRSLLSSLLLAAAFLAQPSSGCTAIIVGKGATVDGSTFTTHNNDCTDCDIRLAVVPSVVYSAEQLEDNKSPVYPCKMSFPRYIGSDRGDTYLAEATEKEAPQTVFEPSRPIGFIPAVARRFSYIEGSYPIANEHGVLMGESTCAARLVAYGKPYGDALFDVAALMRIAMERCKTARCAVETMGKYATEGGYYGANDPPESGSGMYEESGEAVTVIDGEESWVFHVLPDPTGLSAIWAAQRLQDDHFAVVANKFIIRQVDLENKDFFLGSPNMREVAVEQGFWPANRTDFDFALAYAPDAGMPPGWSDRRTWRLMDWVAPSLGFLPDQQEEFPFSVPVDKKLSLEDIEAMNRDHFEGTAFDLANHPAGGPYGNPNRYDRTRRPEYNGGFFERAISLHRTSYSFVVQARSWLPSSLSGVVWFAHHAPHSSLFVPLYGASQDLPSSWKTGTLYQLRRSNAWWAFAAVSNYAEKMFSYIQRDVNKRQHFLEGEAQEEVKKVDQQALALLQEGSEDEGQHKKALQVLTDFTVSNAARQTSDWWDFLDFLFTRYRDGQVLETFEPPLHAIPQFYPAWWLGRVGYYDNGPMPPYMPPMPEPQGPPHPENMPQAAVEASAASQLLRVPSPSHASLKFKSFATADEIGMLGAKDLHASSFAAFNAKKESRGENGQWERMTLEDNQTASSAAVAQAPSSAPSSSSSSEMFSLANLPTLFMLLAAIGSGCFYAGMKFQQKQHDEYEHL